MNRLTITCGIPGSGKSYWALEQIEHDPKIVIVTLSDIRKELGAPNAGYNAELEDLARDIEYSRVAKALRANQNVIVADTNLTITQHKKWHDFARFYGAEFFVKYFDTPLETCIERNRNRDTFHKVDEDKLRKFYKQWLELPRNLNLKMNLMHAISVKSQ